MRIVSVCIHYVHLFHTDENPKTYNVIFGAALLKQAAPQSLKCKWEEIVAFPTLQAAVNPADEGIRIMDIVDQIGSDELTMNLRACDFHIDDKGLAYMWVQKTSIQPIITHPLTQSATPVTIASTTDLTSTSVDNTMHPLDARRLLREHVSRSLKCEIQKMVVDMFPRDDDGVLLCESADDPILRRPRWVMDELYRNLLQNHNGEDACKGRKYALRYVRREVARQRRLLLNIEESSAEKDQMKSEATIWQEGPYGKAWAANIRDRPRPQQLLSCIAGSQQENVYARCVFNNIFLYIFKTFVN